VTSATSPAAGARNRDRVLALARRDLAIELSYPAALAARAGALASLVATFFFIGRIVDPSKLGEYGGRYFEFVLLGLLVNSLATVGLGSFSKTIASEQTSGTLEVLFATPMSLPVFFLGSIIVPVGFIACETALVLFIAIVFLGADFHLSGVVTAALAVGPILAFYSAAGAASAAFLVLSKRGDPFTPLATRVTNFLAGSLFPVAVLPGALQAVAKALPPYHALVVLRSGMLRGEGIGAVWPNYLYLCLAAAVSLPVSLWIFARALRTARTTGTLGNY
jgi:ABC-2 type transport system permease protein